MIKVTIESDGKTETLEGDHFIGAIRGETDTSGVMVGKMHPAHVANSLGGIIHGLNTLEYNREELLAVLATVVNSCFEMTGEDKVLFGEILRDALGMEP